MFKAKEANSKYFEWTKAWKLFVGRKNRQFLQTAEKVIKTPGLEVWVTFQRTITDDPSCLLEFETWPGWFLRADGEYGIIYANDNILPELDFCKENEIFAFVKRARIGPESIFLLTVVKKFREQDMKDCGYERNEKGAWWQIKSEDTLECGWGEDI
ncbi:MAG: hypothetical protein WC805_01770 [Patescibacteria group bacterium]|jgi:hypothetical protein